jgi:hypothetical protein
MGSYASYNVGLNNGTSQPVTFPGSIIVRTDANGMVNAQFDNAPAGVTFIVWLRDVIDSASGGLAPNVSTSAQPSGDYKPGSGIVRVDAGDADRYAEFTHYQYGATIRTKGVDSGGMFEFFLGDQPGHNPDLSVRHNGSNLGAVIEARNKEDSGAIALSFRNPARAELQLRGTELPADMAISHPTASGYISFRIGGIEQARVTGSGLQIGDTLLTEAQLQALLDLL